MYRKVPQSREEITLPWLNAVFQKHNILVHSFTWQGSIDKGLAVMGCLERLTLEVTQLEINNDHNQVSQTLSLIVKTLPIGPPELRHFVINEGFCQREFKMYTEVFPAWEKFQNSRNTPKKYRFRKPTCYYGAEEGEGDDYSMIIIMEDLSSDLQLWPHGFKRGLRWKQAKPMIKQIATFHAVGMAYKEYHGIKNYSEEYKFLHTASKDQEAFKFFLKSGIEQTIQRLQENPENNDENSLPIPEGLVADLTNFVGEIERIERLKFPKDGRAGTICHHDLHVNNIMMPRNLSRGDNAGLLDFQGCCYSSPMNDLTFFLMLNCDPQLFTSGLPKVLQYYQSVFQSAMNSMDMDVEYTLDQITEDYASCVILSIIHILMGAPSWCFGPRTSEDTWRRFRMALVDTYNRSGLRLPMDL